MALRAAGSGVRRIVHRSSRRLAGEIQWSKRPSRRDAALRAKCARTRVKLAPNCTQTCVRRTLVAAQKPPLWSSTRGSSEHHKCLSIRWSGPPGGAGRNSAAARDHVGSPSMGGSGRWGGPGESVDKTHVMLASGLITTWHGWRMAAGSASPTAGTIAGDDEATFPSACGRRVCSRGPQHGRLTTPGSS